MSAITMGRSRIVCPCRAKRIITVTISPITDQGFTCSLNSSIAAGDPSRARVINPAARGSTT